MRTGEISIKSVDHPELLIQPAAWLLKNSEWLIELIVGCSEEEEFARAFSKMIRSVSSFVATIAHSTKAFFRELSIRTMKRRLRELRAKSAFRRKHQASSDMKSPVLRLMLLGGGSSDDAGEAALLAIEDGMQTGVTSKGVLVVIETTAIPQESSVLVVAEPEPLAKRFKQMSLGAFVKVIEKLPVETQKR